MVEERALMVCMRCPRVGGTKAPPPKIHKLCTRLFPPASMSHEGDGLTSREEGTATCTEDYEAKPRAMASTTRTCRLDGCTSASTGWPSPLASRRPCCRVLPAPSPRTEGWVRLSAQTRRLAELASWVAPLALSGPPATILERLRVLARTTALLSLGEGTFHLSW